jgi:long-chain acyl-CoA synthetase
VNLLSLLLEHPADLGTPLVHDLDNHLTKGEIIARVEARAGQIAAVDGQPVAVIAEGIEMLISMFAVWALDAVFVPVNPRQPAPAIDGLIERTDPVAVVENGQVRSRQSSTTHLRPTAFILWTSGTSGRPKAVLHTHDAYIEIIDRILGPLRSRPPDPARPPSPNLIPVSMASNAGIYNSLFGLRAGAPLVIMGRFSTSNFATLVDRHAIRSTVLPPTAMVMLTDDDSIPSLGPLRYVRSITAPLSPFQAKRFTDRFGVSVLNSYGQAEIGEVIGWTAADAKAHPDKIGAAGRAHPGVDIAVDHPDSNGVGELLVKPPNRAVGYADGDDLADRLTDSGQVRTGDLARIDADGFVWIEGRLGDLINRGGNKVHPDEVEEVISSVPGVEEAAVVGRPDDRLGEVPVAFVVGVVPAAELEAACRAHLPPYKIPVSFEPVGELPKNEMGKVLRRVLRESAAAPK